MAKRELIEKEYVEDVLSDTINSEGDYRHALRLLNGATITTEQEIVKPYLEKLTTKIQRLRGCSCSCTDGVIDDVEDVIDNLLSN